MQARNLIVLVCCQMISSAATISLVTLAGIIGASLTTNQAFVTLPVSLLVIAGASATVPASMLMRRIGRRNGSMLASLCAASGMLLTFAALRAGSFWLFCGGVMLVGVNVAFTQQYRFAAAESVDTRFVARAVSFVLLGAIGGAVLGKEITTRGHDWIAEVPYAGTMLALAGLFVLQALLLLALREPGMARHRNGDTSDRPLAAIVLRPAFLTAVLAGVVGYGVMTLIMTATPLSMHIHNGFSIEETSNVIRAHVLAMYVPSLFSGFLIERVGVSRLMFVGACLLGVTSLVGLQGHELLHYWWALVLLGVGWNFLYVGGTTMLTATYAPAERFRAQAFNEFMVFGMAAAASLLAGTVMHYFGWSTLMWTPLPVLAGFAAALVLVRKDPALQRVRGEA